MGASWKTTVSGLIAAGGTLLLLGSNFVLFTSAPPYNIVFPMWVHAIVGYLASLGVVGMGGGIASLGINAKDSQVTGGTVVQPGIPVAPMPVATPAAGPTPAVQPAVKPPVSGWGAR
jgi:hypothetical protein